MDGIDARGHEPPERNLVQCAPLKRRITWVGNSRRSIESGSDSTISRPRHRTWSGLTLNGLGPSKSNTSTQSTSEEPSQPSQKQKAQHALIFLVTGIHLDSKIQLHSPALVSSCKWYLAFLEFKIEQAWNTLLAPVLEDINPKVTSPCDHDIAIAFRFLTAVAGEFQRKEVALANIVDEMYNKCLLHYTDNNRSKAHQLAFAAFGWISILYTPSSIPRPNCLQLDDSCNESLRGSINNQRAANHKPKTFWRLEEDINDNAQLDLPLFQLFKRFGEILPQCLRTCFTPQLSRDISGRHDDRIDISLLCFYAVNIIARINIQWVDCLSLHMEFDSRGKTLKVFRFPSLCLVMYRDRDRSLWSKIFEDYAAAFSGSETDYSNDYFKEVLLTYRLLFGEENRSRKAFRNMISRWQKSWKSTQNDAKPPADPLLLLLGSQSWESDEARQVYDEIGADDPASFYNPTVDFVFFGKRLLDLQTYVRNHRPKNLRGFWGDKRNMQWWWTFWAAVIIGGATLVFQLFQSTLQVIQVVLAQQQVNQGNPGPHDLKLLVRELRDVLRGDL